MSDLLEVHSGDQRMVDFGNEVSDAIHKATKAGLGMDFICSVIVGTAADYWMQTFKDPVTVLSDILTAKHRHAAANKS